MSITLSRKSSFDTVVVEKDRNNLLQFLGNPDVFRQELDLRSLTNAARDSFAILKHWQQAAGCFDHNLVQATIKDVVEQGNKCHSAIKSTLTIAKQGYAFVNNVVAFYDALAEKNRSPERVDELFLNLTKIAEKAYKRSMRSCDQLKDARSTLFQISKNLASNASTMEQDMLNLAGPDDDPVLFNGVDTCFITFPRNVSTVETEAWPPSNLYLGSTSDDEDSDDEDVVVPKTANSRAAWISYPKPKHMSFANVEIQLNQIAQGMSPFIEHFNRIVFWWSKMKDGLEGVKDVLPQLVLDGPNATADVANGWKGVADQFAIYIYKATPIATDYIPHPRHPAHPMPSRLPPLPSPRPGTPLSADCGEKKLSDPGGQKDKPKPLWKRLCCVM